VSWITSTAAAPTTPAGELALGFVRIPRAVTADGKPLARYEEARAEILSRGGTVLGYTAVASADEIDDGPGLKGFFPSLFGGSGTDAPPAALASAPAPSKDDLKFPGILLSPSGPPAVAPDPGIPSANIGTIAPETAALLAALSTL